MGICEILTIIFVVAKLLGIIDWGWLYVLMPEIVAFAFYAVLILLYFFGIYRANRKFHKEWEDLL